MEYIAQGYASAVVIIVDLICAFVVGFALLDSFFLIRRAKRLNRKEEDYFERGPNDFII